MTYSQEYRKFPIYPARVITSTGPAEPELSRQPVKNEGNEAASPTKGKESEALKK